MDTEVIDYGFAPAVFDPMVVCEVKGAPHNPYGYSWRPRQRDHAYAENNGRSLCKAKIRYVTADPFNPTTMTNPCPDCVKEFYLRVAAELADLETEPYESRLRR